MNHFDILRPGMWFGPRDATLLEALTSDPATARLCEICEEFKNGNFSARSDLLLIASVGETDMIRRQATRLYAYTCGHDNVAEFGTLFVTDDEVDLAMSAKVSVDVLSPLIIPYLFKVVEQWKHDEEITFSCLSSIDQLFPFGYDGESVDMDSLAARLDNFASDLLPGAFYFAGEPAHPGALCRELISDAAEARVEGIPFAGVAGPMTLAVWSGIECPVWYGDIVDDAAMARVFAYVEMLAAMPWNPGSKYFYGHLIA
ncbi:hypothetical protein KPL74_09245 [Bacillus sp. NP157]|nr:hypothetical protein KPL74_09245 [Bacillus sp. NP157]